MGLGWVEGAHLARLHGEFLLEAWALVKEAVHHLILGSIVSHAPEAASGSIWSSANKAIMLQALVVLNVFRELAERVTRC